MELFTYETFSDKSNVLSFETAGKIYSELVGLVEIGGPELQKYWSDFLHAAVTYAARRASWLLLSREQKVATDDQRTAEHDAVLYSIAVIRGTIAQQGLPLDWYHRLIFDNVQERKRVGDFACYVAYIYGVNAR